MMFERMLNLMGAERYVQHSICLTNDPLLITLYIAGDTVTAISYFILGSLLLISTTTPIHIRPALRPLFGLFIFICGLSHFTEVTTLFWGIYRLDVFVTAIMSAVSGVTAYVALTDALVQYKRNRLEKKRAVEESIQRSIGG